MRLRGCSTISCVSTDGSAPCDHEALVFTMDTRSVDELASDVSSPCFWKKVATTANDFEFQTSHKKILLEGKAEALVDNEIVLIIRSTIHPSMGQVVLCDRQRLSFELFTKFSDTCGDDYKSGLSRTFSK